MRLLLQSDLYIYIFFSFLRIYFHKIVNEWALNVFQTLSLFRSFCYRIFLMPIDKSVCVNHSILLLTKNFSPSNLLDFLLISLNTVAPLFFPSSWSFFLSFFSFGIFPFHCFVISPKHFCLNLLWFASFFAVLNRDSNNFCWKTVDKICLRVAISSLKRFTVVSYVVLLTQWMGWNKIKNYIFSMSKFILVLRNAIARQKFSDLFLLLVDGKFFVYSWKHFFPVHIFSPSLTSSRPHSTHFNIGDLLEAEREIVVVLSQNFVHFNLMDFLANALICINVCHSILKVAKRWTKIHNWNHYWSNKYMDTES